MTYILRTLGYRQQHRTGTSLAEISLGSLGHVLWVDPILDLKFDDDFIWFCGAYREMKNPMNTGIN